MVIENNHLNNIEEIEKIKKYKSTNCIDELYIENEHNKKIVNKDFSMRDLYNMDIATIKTRKLTLDEEQEYIKKIRQGDLKAKKEFVELNLKLVISISKKYIVQSELFNNLDIIQEGNIGLLNAIEKYDLKRKNKFSTVAFFWINQSIKRALEEKTRTIRLPNYRIQLLNKINKFIEEYRSSFFEDPSDELIAETLGISIKKLQSIKNNNIIMIPLHNTCKDNPDLNLENIIDDGFDIHDNFEKNETYKLLKNSINLLSKDEQKIIYLKFYKEYTISKIEKEINISRSKINMLLENALHKMKNNLESSII